MSSFIVDKGYIPAARVGRKSQAGMGWMRVGPMCRESYSPERPHGFWGEFRNIAVLVLGTKPAPESVRSLNGSETPLAVRGLLGVNGEGADFDAVIFRSSRLLGRLHVASTQLEISDLDSALPAGMIANNFHEDFDRQVALTMSSPALLDRAHDRSRRTRSIARQELLERFQLVGLDHLVADKRAETAK